MPKPEYLIDFKDMRFIKTNDGVYELHEEDNDIAVCSVVFYLYGPKAHGAPYEEEAVTEFVPKPSELPVGSIIEIQFNDKPRRFVKLGYAPNDTEWRDLLADHSFSELGIEPYPYKAIFIPELDDINDNC